MFLARDEQVIAAADDAVGPERRLRRDVVLLHRSHLQQVRDVEVLGLHPRSDARVVIRVVARQMDVIIGPVPAPRGFVGPSRQRDLDRGPRGRHVDAHAPELPFDPALDDDVVDAGSDADFDLAAAVELGRPRVRVLERPRADALGPIRRRRERALERQQQRSRGDGEAAGLVADFETRGKRIARRSIDDADQQRRVSRRSRLWPAAARNGRRARREGAAIGKRNARRRKRTPDSRG